MTSNNSGSIGDSALTHKLGHLYLPFNRFLLQGGIAAATLPSLGTGVGVATEVGAAELTKFGMSSGDMISCHVDMDELWDADLDHVIQAQIKVEHAGGAADANVDFKLHVTGQAAGVVMTAPSAAADNVVIFPAMTLAVGYNESSKMPLVTAATIVDDKRLLLSVELDDDGDASTDEVCFVGLSLWYTRQMCSSSGMQETT